MQACSCSKGFGHLGLLLFSIWLTAFDIVHLQPRWLDQAKQRRTNYVSAYHQCLTKPAFKEVVVDRDYLDRKEDPKQRASGKHGVWVLLKLGSRSLHRVLGSMQAAERAHRGSEADQQVLLLVRQELGY